MKILLSHGSGGRLTHDLIKNTLLKKLNNPILRELTDSAFLDYKEKIAFTTDSFVVSPIKFPGGDIGKLSICGTINDLVMTGAQPEYISLGLIVEEGLDYAVLEDIISSISKSVNRAGVAIVTGDFKVVEKGACDKIFINTSGIGRIVTKVKLSSKNIKPNDKVILTGNIGQHGLSVLAKRKELDLGFNIKSDCAALNKLIIPILKKTGAVKFMRDPTRGGVATTLNEIVSGTSFGIAIEEKNLPISRRVRVASELLGIDPLYVANEGVALLVVKDGSESGILTLLKRHPLGRKARIIGKVINRPKGKVILHTVVGTARLLGMLPADPLPRIC